MVINIRSVHKDSVFVNTNHEFWLDPGVNDFRIVPGTLSLCALACHESAAYRAEVNTELLAHTPEKEIPISSDADERKTLKWH